MKTKKKFFKVLMFLLPVLMAVSVPLAAAAVEGKGVFEAYLNLIDAKGLGVIDRVDLTENLIKGALSGTDKYTYFQKIEEYNSFMDEYKDANFVGIGVTITEDEKGAFINSIFNNSPAYKAGLQAGDIIVSVDGINVGGKTLTEIASRVKGPVGTEVKIGVLVNGVGGIVFFTIERDSIQLTTVSYTIYRETAYIRITGFTNKTGEEFAAILERVEKAGTNKLIIDVRNNGGGTVRGCIDVARKLLSNETIVKLQFRYPGYLDIRYRAPENDKEYNVVLIVNKNTASASEILSAALRDNDKGVLVGETTYGKSLVQTSYKILTQKAYDKYSKITDESDMYIILRKLASMKIVPEDYEWQGAVKMTIGEYITPKGNVINNQGITPDIIVVYNGPIAFDEASENEIWVHDKYNVGMTSEEIKKAKLILAELGYYTGDTTEYYGEDIFGAVMDFQKDEGLYPYGVLDYTTQNALNNRSRLFHVEKDPQFMAAYNELKGDMQ